MNVQGAFNLLFRAGLRKDFRDDYDMYEPEYVKYLRQSTMDTPEISATIMTGPSRMTELGDGEPITMEDLIIGPKVMGTDKEWGIGLQLTQRAVEDDQYGKLKAGAKYMAHAARMTQEYRSAQLLDDAFTGSTFLGIDGLSLINAAHTYLNASGTWRNTPSAQVGLGVTGVTALLDLAAQQRDHNGDPMKVVLDKILIPNSFGAEAKARQIFTSTLEPFTAENQDNIIKQKFGSMNIEVMRFMQSMTNYFMQSSKLNDAHFVVRRPVTQDDNYDFLTRAAQYSATQRFLIWFVDPRGWYGSNPT